MDNSYQHSTIAQILENILNEFVFEGESRSDIADILLSILNKTEYNKETDSVIADLLIRLKAKIEGESYDPYDAAYTSRIAEILISILEETEYTEEPQSRIAELLLELKEELEAYTELTASGSIASFITNVVKPFVNGEFTIQAYQEGTGDPSPVNVRNIVPRREVNIVNMNDITYKAYFYGLLNGTYGFIDLGTLTWGYSGTVFYSNVIPTLKSPTNNIICPLYETTPYNIPYANMPDKSIKCYGGIENRIIYIKDSNYTDPATFKTAMNGVYLIYELATPTTPTITDTQFEMLLNAFGINGELYTVNLGEDTYGAVYNSVTGVLTVTHFYKSFTWSQGTSSTVLGDYTRKLFAFSPTSYCKYPPTDSTQQWCNLAPYKRNFAEDSLHFYCNDTEAVVFLPNDISGDTVIEVRAELETPITIQLPTTNIETLLGENNIFCDTGDTSVTYLYKGTPPETLTRAMSKSPIVEDIIKEEELKDLKDLDELQELDISEKEGL